MAAHRVAHHRAQIIQRFSFGEDGVAECACGLTAFGRFIHLENDFVHGYVAMLDGNYEPLKRSSDR